MVDLSITGSGEVTATLTVRSAGGLETIASVVWDAPGAPRRSDIAHEIESRALDNSRAAPFEDPDRVLLARIARGERDALAALYSRHGDTVLSYVLAVCSDRGRAEEVLQDTFVAVWRYAGSFEGRAKVRTWLLAIARRQALSKVRRRREEPTDPVEFLAEPATDLTPEEEALSRAALERLAAAIGRLGSLQREIVALAFVQQLSYAEMADVLEVPIGTVRSRLAGARRQLAHIIDETGAR